MPLVGLPTVADGDVVRQITVSSHALGPDFVPAARSAADLAFILVANLTTSKLQA
jgi:hypothetical protein